MNEPTRSWHQLRWPVVALVAVTALAGSAWLVSRRVLLFIGGQHFVATGLTFVDEQHGWALGFGHCGGSRFCLMVERTQDGGRTWRAVGKPAGVGPPPNGVACTDLGRAGPCVDHIVFADLNTGYLWSELSLYVTGDGGQTWIARRGNAASLIATHATVLRASASGVESSRVGADSWRTVTPNGAAPLADLRLAVAAQRPATVLVSAGSNASRSRDSPTGYLSHDGGTSWRPVPGIACGASGSSSGNAMSLAPDGTLVVDCFTLGTGGDPERVFISRDGGQTYNQAAGPPHSDRTGPRQLVAVSSSVWLYLVGPDYHRSPQSIAYRTADAGRTWHKSGTPDFYDGYPVFLTASFGYALTSSQGPPVVSTDGGAHWHTRRVR